MLRPQINIKQNKYNFWKHIHDKVQYLLDIHSNQGNKIAIFPLDLQIMILNKWFSNENNSYVPTYNENSSYEDFRKLNIEKIQNERKKIHDRLQYLLNIHSNKEVPMPIDLAFMLNLDAHYLIDSYNYDKNYDYERLMDNYFYSGPTGYFSFLFKDNNDHNFTYSFYDCEDDDIFKFKCLEKKDSKLKVEYIAPPTRYLLWKSCTYDVNYDYNRSLSGDKYMTDMYLPYESDEEEDIEYSQYYQANDESEPDFNKFKSLLI